MPTAAMRAARLEIAEQAHFMCLRVKATLKKCPVSGPAAGAKTALNPWCADFPATSEQRMLNDS